MSDSPPVDNGVYTLDNGCPIRLAQGTLRVGQQPQGVHLIRDINLIETLSHITHERIPERVVHAKGAGAYGEFKVTDADFITKYTDADFLNTNDKTTPLFARFSTVIGERGSADSVRDTRGFAFKLRTAFGNLDWVFFSTPTFPIRDGAKFPSFVHAQKRNPQTGVRDATTFWDFMSRNPETFNTIMSIFSDRGTPLSYRYSDIYSVNTYKFTKNASFILSLHSHLYHRNFVNGIEKFWYVRLHLSTNQGVRNLSQSEAEKLAGADPDAYTRDLYNAIQTGSFPSWDVKAQIITPENVAKYPVFDPTKWWKVSQTKFGTITLKMNPSDYFEEVEQVSFSPAAVVPGWDVSPDPILQTRLFAYGSAARYRLGINFRQIPVNASPLAYNPTKRDGRGYVNQLDPKIQPNYFPADDAPARTAAVSVQSADQDFWSGQVVAFESTVTDDDWKQPGEIWNSFTADEKEAFVSNVALSLKGATEDVRQRTYDCFGKINIDLEERLKKAIGDDSPSDAVEQSPRLVLPNRGGIGG